jgi:hypothetical protein
MNIHFVDKKINTIVATYSTKLDNLQHIVFENVRYKITSSQKEENLLF